MAKFSTLGSDYLGVQFMGVNGKIAALIDSGASNTLIDRKTFSKIMVDRKSLGLPLPT